jgi:hypothetical protein
MTQIYYVYIEGGVAEYERLSSAVVLKARLNAKGIKARIRRRKPMAIRLNQK